MPRHQIYYSLYFSRFSFSSSVLVIVSVTWYLSGILFRMEWWFIFAAVSAITSGIAGFSNKIAAHHDLDSGLIIFYSALMSTSVLLPITLVMVGTNGLSWPLFFFGALSGLVAAISSLFKIRSLKYIDTTIFFPLFKLVAPLLAIIFGIVLFSEHFNGREWLGLILSLFIPLLLITKVENARQKHLVQGLLWMLAAGFTAALIAVIHKFNVETFDSVYWIVTSSSIGVFVGGFASFLIKHKIQGFTEKVRERTSRFLLITAAWRSACLSVSIICTILAFSLGGTLGIVYTINSMYILIPIVLAIYFYDEHWNTQKVVAIVLSILALLLFA